MPARSFARVIAFGLALAEGHASAEPARAVRLDSAFFARLAGARRHPFADGSGKLPLVIELPPGASARSMGWQPLAPGLATLRLLPEEVAAFEAGHPGARFSVWPHLHPVLDASAKLNR